MVERKRKFRIMILHGPNLNLLGTREPELYGKKDLQQINRELAERAAALGVEIRETCQSDSEAELIGKIHAARESVDGLVFNPAAFTHTSVALRDSLLAAAVPFVEVHLSNISAREPFRHESFFSDIAVGVVSGFGAASYLIALEGLVGWLKERTRSRAK